MSAAFGLGSLQNRRRRVTIVGLPRINAATDTGLKPIAMPGGEAR